MRVTVKELVRWLDSFGLPSTPWAAEPADWATALNLLARLLHPTLAQRVEEATKSLEEASEPEESAEEGQKEAREDHQQLLRRQSQQTHPSTQLALQEALEMAERVLGIPQFAVVADLKRGPAENQLALFVTLCALHFAMGPADTKPFRDFQFTFRIYFDMDADGSRRECTACGQLVHLIERLVLNGHVWHRACLKCALCGRQLYRGAFHWLHLGGDSFRLECVEHRANAVLFGDPKQRLAAIPPLPPPSSMSVSQHSALSQQPPEKRASLVSSVHSPPPRPPPPRMAASVISSTQKQQTEEEKADEDEEESIERKIALAAAARHDAPVPRPRQSLLNKQPKPPEKKTGEKTSWEVLEYPEELNPFGSEEEEEEMEEEGSLQSRRRPHSKDAAANPFETDSEEEEGIVQVDNPQDRVLASPKPSTTGDSAPGSSGCPSPLGQQQNHPAMVQLVQPVCKQEPGPQPSSAAAIDAKMHEPADSCYEESEEQQQPSCWQFVPPLGPMPFRLGQEKPGKASPAPQPTAATSTPSEQQHQMHELDTKLRRLHAQLDQWEITGARLEGQMLRELLATQKDSQQQQLHQMHVWRKGNKLANEFAQLVEQRCAALATEAVLVRRYVDHFLALAHAELDRQMREQLQLGGTKDEARKRQFNDLLALLLHIRNELTELESRERQAKAAKATPPNPTAEKTAKAEAKKEAKKEKEEQQQKAEPLKKKKSAETASEESGVGGGAEGVGEEKKKSAAAKSKPKGDKEETTKEKEGKGRLLKNTLKNLKKKL